MLMSLDITSVTQNIPFCVAGVPGIMVIGKSSGATHKSSVRKSCIQLSRSRILISGLTVKEILIFYEF